MSRTACLTAFLALAAAGTASPLAAQSTRQSTKPATAAVGSDSVDRAMVALLSQADQAEIAQVRQAAPTLKDADVKKYAQMLIDDHTRAYSEVSAIAAKLGYPATTTRYSMPPADPVMPPIAKPVERPGPSPSEPMRIDPNPDREFIEAQITAHQQLLSQLPGSDSAIQNRELREHVGETRRVVQTHLTEARRLRDKIAGAIP